MIVINMMIIVIAPQPQRAEVIKTYWPPEPQPREPQPDDVPVKCDQCGWKNVYQDQSTARRGLAGHKNWCNGRGPTGPRKVTEKRHSKQQY